MLIVADSSALVALAAADALRLLVRGLAFHIVGHELHHLRIVREKYLRLPDPGSR